MRRLRIFFVALLSVSPAFPDAPCSIKTIAGPSTFFAGDGGPATKAYFYNIGGFRFDGSGILYIADTNNHRVRKVTPDGIVTTVAGNGNAGSAGDGGLATSASLDGPTAVATDAQGDLFIADANANRIRKVDASGIITTYAGTGVAGFSGDGGPAAAARLYNPSDVIVLPDQSILFVDFYNYRVRRIDSQGAISTFAGGGNSPSTVEDGLATSLYLTPTSLAADSTGNVYVGEYHTVLHVTKSGAADAYAGGGSTYNDGGPATQAYLDTIIGLALDGAGNLFIATGNAIREVNSAGIISSLSQYPDAPTSGIAFDKNGTLYARDGATIFDRSTLNRVAGVSVNTANGDGGPAAMARLAFPYGLTLDKDGAVYIGDEFNYDVRKVDRNGTISLFAGGYPYQPASGDGPFGVTAMSFDQAGNLFIGTDDSVFKLNTNGVLTGLFGGLVGRADGLGSAPDGSIYVLSYNILSQFGPIVEYLRQVATNVLAFTVDSAGDVFYLANHQLIQVGFGVIATLPETPDFPTTPPATLARDSAGNFFISFIGNCCVVLQEVASDGTVGTIARQSYSLPYADGPASAVTLGFPFRSAVDSAGNLFFTDAFDYTARELTAGCAVVPTPMIAFDGSGNAAGSYGGVAPGELMSIYGWQLGPATGVVASLTPDGNFPVSLAGVQVLVNGTAAPLLYVSQSQINFVMPYEIAGIADFPIQVVYDGVAGDATDGESDRVTGLGIFAIANPDGSNNTQTNPAPPAGYIVIYGTGQGLMNPPLADGSIASATTLSYPVLPVSATIDGNSIPEAYAGSALGLVAGVLQVNLVLPVGLSSGQHTLGLLSNVTASPTTSPFWVAGK